jgi:hypothetical protein
MMKNGFRSYKRILVAKARNEMKSDKVTESVLKRIMIDTIARVG